MCGLRSPEPRFGGLGEIGELRPRGGEMARFESDEVGYRQWIAHNQDGYVINYKVVTGPGSFSADPVLHRADCRTIRPTPGRRWTRLYGKECGDNRKGLERLARARFGGDADLCGH